MRINYFGILLCAMALSASLVLVAPVACDMIELLAQQEDQTNCDPIACSRVAIDQDNQEQLASDHMIADTLISTMVPCRLSPQTL